MSMLIPLVAILVMFAVAYLLRYLPRVLAPKD